MRQVKLAAQPVTLPNTLNPALGTAILNFFSKNFSRPPFTMQPAFALGPV
jgi:hypothetical protein